MDEPNKKYVATLENLFFRETTLRYFGLGKVESFRKKGPGRKAIHGKPGNRLNKQKPLRAFRALVAYFDRKRFEARQAKKPTLPV